MSNTDKIKAIQTILGVTADGAFGPISRAALEKLINGEDGVVHSGKASSFADPADVAAFKKCKAEGNSDNYCFSKGDNGIGTPTLGKLDATGKRIGADTTGNVPMCALPPEDWKPLGSKAPGALVLVTANGKKVVCELRDTMPKRANIKNGAVIDLSPAASKALGLKPPFMVPCTWQWA